MDKSIELEGARLGKEITEQNISGDVDIDKEAETAEPSTASSEPPRGGGDSDKTNDVPEAPTVDALTATAKAKASPKAAKATAGSNPSPSSGAGSKRKAEQADDSERIKTERQNDCNPSSSSSSGSKRKAEQADDSARLDTDSGAQGKQNQGMKRKAEDVDDATMRKEGRSEDMASVAITDARHPVPIKGSEKTCKADLEWKHIGSGIM